MKDALKVLHNLTIADVLVISLAFMITAGPGYLMLALFKPDWLLTLDGLKCTILAFSLVMPIVIVAAFISSLVVNEATSKSSYAQHVLLITAVACISTIYPALFLAHTNKWDFNTFILVETGLLVIGFPLSKIGYRKLINDQSQIKR